MNSAMQQLSMSHIAHFDHAAALKELYIYVTQYNNQILEALEMVSNVFFTSIKKLWFYFRIHLFSFHILN